MTFSFRLGGIPITIQPIFFGVILLLGLGAFDGVLLATWVLIAFVSVLVHELGHAVAFRAYGQHPTVTLHAIGGLTAGEAELSPARSVVVSLAGPLAAMALFGLPAWVVHQSGAVVGTDGRIVLEQVLFVNIGWSLLNLAPVLPLDGGNVTRSVIDLLSDGRGEQPARIISILVAGALALWGASISALGLMLVGGMFAALNISALSSGRASQVDARLVEAIKRLLQRDAGGAVAVLDGALTGRLSSGDRSRVLDLRAWAQLATGDVRGARGTIDALPRGTQPSTRTRGALALAEGRPDEAITLLTWSLAHERSPAERLLIAQLLGGTGLGPTVAGELRQLDGDRGRTATVELVEHLRRVGFPDEAARTEAQLLAP